MIIIKDYLLSLLRTPRTRLELCGLTQMNDRAVRRYIKELTKEGNCIIHDSKSNTYKLTEDIEEMEAYLSVIDSYQSSLSENYIEMRKRVAEARGKRVIPVRQHYRTIGNGQDSDQIKMRI